MNDKRNLTLVGIVIIALFLSTCNTTPTTTPISTTAIASAPPQVSTQVPTPTSELPIILGAMIPVTKGEGIPEAAIYDPSSAELHHIVLLESSGAPHTWNSNIPPDWLPVSINETELVALIGLEEEVALDTQRYTISGSEALSITRYRSEIQVEVREARTGLALWNGTLRGSEPGPFPETAPAGQTRIDGGHASFGDLKEWLSCKVLTQVCEMYTLEGPDGGVNFVAFLPDGQSMVSGPHRGTLRLWRVSDGSQLRTPDLKNISSLEEVAFSPERQILATVSWDDNKTVRLWQISDGEPVGILQGHTEQVESIAFSPDGKWLASESSGGRIIIWDVANMREVQTLMGLWYTEIVGSLAFSPDGNLLASGTGEYSTVIIWDVASWSILRTLEGHLGDMRVVFSPDSVLLATGADFDNTVILWRASDGEMVHTLQGHTGFVSSIAFSPDGQWLASASSDGTVKIWDVASGQEVHTLSHADNVTSVVFSPDGQILALGSYDGTIQLWRICRMLKCP